MFDLSKYTRLEKNAFIWTFFFVVAFWLVILTSDESFIPGSIFTSSHDNQKLTRERFCQKSENKRRKYCIELQIEQKEKWEDITRSTDRNGKTTAFSLGKW